MSRPTKLIVSAIIAVAVVALITLVDFERSSHERPLEMSPATTASGRTFEISVPSGYLLVTDERVAVPPGAVALADEHANGRSTIVVSPYPRSDQSLFTETGCHQVAKLQAKQIGAQLENATATTEPRQCIGHLSEGGDVRGIMVLLDGGDEAFMITCRFPESAGPQACLDVATSLQPAHNKAL